MKDYLNIIKYEIQIDIKEVFKYKISIISSFIIFLLTYIAIFYFNVSTGFVNYYKTTEHVGNVLVLIGYLFWQISSYSLGYSATQIMNEASRGELELRLQSKYSISLLLFFKMISSFLSFIVIWAGIFGFALIIHSVQFSDIGYILLSFLIAIPSIMGMYGMGLILGGVALIEKNVGQFIYLIQLAILFLSNSLSPTRSILINILPFNIGIEITRNLYMGINISSIKVLSYFIVNIFWLTIGTYTFNRILHFVRKKGSFDNY